MVRKHYDWEPVEQLIREWWEQGCSSRQISFALKTKGFGEYPPANVSAHAGKYRGTDVGEKRKIALNGRSHAPQFFDPTSPFQCTLCENFFQRKKWNQRFCKGCTSKYTTKQINRYKMYGLKPETFDSMMLTQNFCCRLCFVKFELDKTTAGPRNPCVDHDHGTGEVRGILCLKCNWALAMVEIPGWSERAMNHLNGKREDGR